MLVLGLNDMINAGAALLQDGHVLAAVGEERLNRMKLTAGYPREAIRTVIEAAGVRASEIDAVAVGQRHGYFHPEAQPCPGWLEMGSTSGGMRGRLMAMGSALSPLVGGLGISRSAYHAAKRWATRKRPARFVDALRRDFGIVAPARFYDHHYTHACSAWYNSDLDDALVVTMDGGGDSHSAHVYSARGGALEFLKRVDSFDSVGNYYSYVTNLCGFRTHRHEGKITGLAANGEPVYLDILRRFIRSDGRGGMRNTGRVAFDAAVRKLRDALPHPFDRADLAASVQALLEEIALDFVRYWLRRTGHRRLVLAGGVMANVKLNQRLMQLEDVHEVFVFPAMDDGGLPVGAALARRHEDHPFRRGGTRLPHVYWGPGFDDRTLESAVQAAGVEYRRSPDIQREVAELLARGEVVCRFQGPLEFGPRALGNRSILYTTTDPGVNDWLNHALVRTEFMPFAPATLVEHAERCYVDYRKAADCSRFMTITFDCTALMRRTSPGVVHVDGTARPQIVDAETSPDLHRILTEYHRRTRIPSLINTSFNMHEEPIVCTPEEALRALEQSGLDWLAMGSLLVRGPGQVRAAKRRTRGLARPLEIGVGSA